MPVLDASVFVEALVGVGPAGDAAREIVAAEPALQVPAIFGAEVTSALRGLTLRGELSIGRASAARRRLRLCRTVSHPFEPFADRVWALRGNLTVYEAWYVALAERLGTEVVTLDRRLGGAPGPRCPVRCI